MGVLGTIGGVVLLLLGGGFLVVCGLGTRRYLNLREAQPKAGSDVGDGEQVVVTGEVATDGGLVSPLRERSCVAYWWEMEEYVDSTDRTGGRWNLRASDGGIEPFELTTEDGTTVTVDPPDDAPASSLLQLRSLGEVCRVEPGGDPPEPVQRLVDRGAIDENEASFGEELQRSLDDDRTPPGSRRYLERTVSRGDSLHVYGEGDRSGGGVRITAGDVFSVTDEEPESLQRNTLYASILLGMLGLALLYFAVLVLS